MILMANRALRSVWRRFITPPSTGRLLRRAAWSLWLIPPLMMSPMLVLFFFMDLKTAGEAAVDMWPLLCGFVVLPALVGLYLWKRAQRLEKK